MHYESKFFKEADYKLLCNVYCRTDKATGSYVKIAKETMIAVKLCAHISKVSLKDLLLKSGLLIKEGHCCQFILKGEYVAKKCSKGRSLGSSGCECHDNDMADIVSELAKL